jgi:hypothetical protein
MARFARGDVRRGAAVFAESDETTVSHNQLCFRDPFRRVRLQIGGANIAGRIAPVNSPTSLSLADDEACRVRSWIE